MANRPNHHDETKSMDPIPPEAAIHSPEALSHPGASRTANSPTTANDEHSEAAPPIDPNSLPIQKPFSILSLALSAENDGPQLRLLRSNKFQQMQIQFDEKPSEAIRILLNAEGWKWRNPEKVWTKQLDPEARWRTQADAEKLVKEIGDTIRADAGLSPTLETTR